MSEDSLLSEADAERFRDPYAIGPDNALEWAGGAFELLLTELPRFNPTVHMHVQIAKSVASCVICMAAIPKGTVRLSVVVDLPEPKEDKRGNVRRTERFNMHAACVVEAFAGVDVALRAGRDCYDCGAPPKFTQGHPWRAFTGSRHAWAPLCSDCSARSRWRLCEGCLAFFPAFMVSRVVNVGDNAREEFIDENDVPDMVCDACADKLGVKTLFQQRKETEEFEALRNKIASGQVFGR